MYNKHKFKKWLMPSFWNIFLGFFFIKFFISPLPFPGMWLSLFALAVYLSAYYWGYYHDNNKKLIAALIMIFSGIIASPYNWGASVFFQYSALYIGLSSNPKKAFVMLFILIMIILGLTNIYQLSILNFTMPAVLVSITLGFFGVFERINKKNKRKILENEKEIKRLDTIAERERIARDLHDVLGHTLTVIFLKCDVAKKILYENKLDTVYSELTQIEETARQTSKMLHKIIVNYQDTNLTLEINNLIMLLEQLNYQVVTDINISELNSIKIEKALSLIIRESVTNIIRHAEADYCGITLNIVNRSLHFNIKDNGKTNKKINFGKGLNGMRDRVKLLEGTFEVKQNSGISININIPIN